MDAIARQLELLPSAAPDTPGEATRQPIRQRRPTPLTQEETPTAAETAEPADIREPVEEPTPAEPLAPTATETTEPADIREPAQEPTLAEPLAPTATETAEVPEQQRLRYRQPCPTSQKPSRQPPPLSPHRCQQRPRQTTIPKPWRRAGRWRTALHRSLAQTASGQPPAGRRSGSLAGAGRGMPGAGPAG